MEDLNAATDERFAQVVASDALGSVSANVASALRGSPEIVRRWRDALRRMAAEVDAALSRVDGEIKAGLADSLSAGPAAKASFFAWKAGKERERLRLVREKVELCSRLRESKALLHGTSQDEHQRKDERINAIERKLDRLIELVESLVYEED
jgi:hypothetical protein